MPNPVLILHGWSDNIHSFVPLKQWLVQRGHPTAQVFLGNYESMEDNVTFDDLADGLQTRLESMVRNGTLTLEPFSLDAIVHSTGGPVIRHWLHHYLYDVCRGDLARCPIKRLIMLAPANFGSRLAAQGKSTLAKLFRGGVAHGFQTGRRVLEGLELGSPVLWQMAENDLFCGQSVYPVSDQGPWLFIFSGTRTYGELKGFVARGANEDGSDGTIRAAAASLNSVRLCVDYCRPEEPQIRAVTRSRSAPAAFRLVEGVNHSQIVPDGGDANHPTFALVEQCLGVQNRVEYEALASRFERENEAFYQRQRRLFDLGTEHRVHAYQQFVVRVRDDMGNSVDDYRLDFHVVDQTIANSTFDPRRAGDPTLVALRRYQHLTRELQEEVIANVQPHSANQSYRTFFVNLDRLEALQAKLPAGAFIGLNLDAAGPTPDLTYDTDRLRYLPTIVPLQDQDGGNVTFFACNTSTLVEILVQRLPSERVFTVSTALPPDAI